MGSPGDKLPPPGGRREGSEFGNGTPCGSDDCGKDTLPENSSDSNKIEIHPRISTEIELLQESSSGVWENCPPGPLPTIYDQDGQPVTAVLIIGCCCAEKFLHMTDPIAHGNYYSQTLLVATSYCCRCECSCYCKRDTVRDYWCIDIPCESNLQLCDSYTHLIKTITTHSCRVIADGFSACDFVPDANCKSSCVTYCNAALNCSTENKTERQEFTSPCGPRDCP